MEKKQNTRKVQEKHEKGPIAVIRISGMVKVKPEIVNTLDRLKLRRKYACIIVNSEKKEIIGMLLKVKNNVAYGNVSKDTLKSLIFKRGKADKSRPEPEKTESKIKKESEKLAEEIFSGRKLQELGLKPYFRLHPPRKGIDSKKHYPNGVLGNHKQDINKLIERMI